MEIVWEVLGGGFLLLRISRTMAEAMQLRCPGVGPHKDTMEVCLLKLSVAVSPIEPSEGVCRLKI